MRYISTRGAAPALGFEDVVLTGLARDGGLYIPEQWSAVAADDLRAMADADYADCAFRVMRPYIDAACIDDEALRALIGETYAVGPDASFRLERPFVDPVSVIVSTADGSLLLVEGLDYRLLADGPFLEVRLLPGSRLAPGDPVAAAKTARTMTNTTETIVPSPAMNRCGSRSASAYR